MTRVLLLLALAGVGWWALSQPRRVSYRRLLRRVYRHVDEVLGARKWENDRRASRRRLVQWFSHDLANLLYPMAQYTGAAALPATRRMQRYVHLTLPARRPWQRYHRWEVRSVWLSWTPEAAANGGNFVEWLERGRPREGGGLAQALGLEWTAGLFEHTFDRDRDRIRFDRTRPAVVPDRLDADEELA